MIDILTATPDQVRAEAERRTRLRADGKPLHEIGEPYETYVLGSGGTMTHDLRSPEMQQKKPPRSHGGRGGAGRRSKWQAEWAGHLYVMERAGDLTMVREEGMSFALEDPDQAGRRVFYRPDFYVVRRDGVHELHEAKGNLEDDARQKMRWFAQRWPELGLRVLTKKEGRWVHLLSFNTQPWPYGGIGA